MGRKDNWSLDQAIRWKNTSRKSYRKWIADSLAYRKWIGKSPQSVSSRSETIGLAPPYQKIYIKGIGGVGVGVRSLYNAPPNALVVQASALIPALVSLSSRSGGERGVVGGETRSKSKRVRQNQGTHLDDALLKENVETPLDRSLQVAARVAANFACLQKRNKMLLRG